MQGSKGNTDKKNRLLVTVGEGEGEGVKTRQGGIETYALPYIKQLASGNLLYDAGTPKLVFCDNLEMWDGEGNGRED